MSIGSILYNLIIYPPVQIIEFAYMLFYKVFKNPSIAILGISVAVTFSCLPLYVVAEKWQEIERDTQKRLSPMLTNIKAVFKGDERFMILQEFYRQNHYHPLYALRSSFGVLIQIPFFIAAYTYLSHMEALKGVSLFFIRDLGAPDSFTRIGGFPVNILPIVMTLINVISGIIYTKGFPFRDKVQLYGIAAVFLVLLYHSPAGLVIYWTMNNILSLIKNIFYKLKNPLNVLYICICILITCIIFYLLFIGRGQLWKKIFLSTVFALIYFIPLFIRFGNYILKKWLVNFLNNKKTVFILFFTSSITLVLLIGLCIPSIAISSSPDEFSFIDTYKSPMAFLLNSFSQTAGFFLLWPAIIFALYKEKLRTSAAFLFVIFSVYAIINAFVFQGNYGIISTTYTFIGGNVLTAPNYLTLINILVFVIIIALSVIVIKKKKIVILNSIVSIAISFLCIFSIYNLVIIAHGYRKVLTMVESSGPEIHKINPVFSLSKTGKNVIVLMQDNTPNGFLKYIFAEHPQLVNQFDGFVYYPNTVSFGIHTLTGVPPIWGGYEYTPREMNKNVSEPLKDKHNNALMVLPLLFKKADYDVTVADQSWANYSWYADLSIYDNTGINTTTTIRKYSTLWYMQHDLGDNNFTSKKIMRNTVWFSLLKISPLFLRSIIYDDGFYWSPENQGTSIANFINNYSALYYLPELTTYDSEKSSVLFLTNELDHECVFLQYPDYVPVSNVTNKGTGKFSNSVDYHTNNAFYLLFGNFLDVLKKNNVYDNTRIIIVADHGMNAGIYKDLKIPFNGENIEKLNPILLVKDFDAKGPLKTDTSFMTNADVPEIAIQGIIPNAANPFTGKILTSESKKSGVTVSDTPLSMPYQHTKYKFNITSDQWFHVHDNIFDPNNWEKADN